MSFVVFALPRCRTVWLSRFLTYAGWQCGHEELRHCRSLDDVRSWLAQPLTGSAETAAAPFWRLLPQLAPGCRVVTMRRPLHEVMASLRNAGAVFEDATLLALLRRVERKLDQIERRLPDVLRVEFADLDNEATCRAIFEHCLGLSFDAGWWRHWAPLNVQVNVAHMYRYYATHAPQVEKLRRLARYEMLRTFRRPIELDGVTFQQEPLQQAFTDPDGQRLMAEECVSMGEEPEAWRGMNIPLFERLEAMGNLHIFTARSNGRMFGYVVTALGEAFHARGQWEADQVSFFADPSWPGLGRKLQHAAIEDLRARGAARVLMFQPDETRVGLVYRRLGARQTGQRFVLELR